MITGRTDKKFCSALCKSYYHKKLKAHTKSATDHIDKILHRNRSILQELLGKKLQSKNVARAVLDDKQFNFGYLTGYHINSQNKMINFVYDFSWMIFSDQHVLIKKIKTRV